MVVPIGEIGSSVVSSKCLMREVGSRPCHLEVICKCWLREKKVLARQRAETGRECSRPRSSRQAIREGISMCTVEGEALSGRTGRWGWEGIGTLSRRTLF